ncbi:MAG: SDR family oxidoreductase [Thaumarchaeota archaeon]|nr:SDR family oxidoreductase [Nitrososphaerota archaeon]
MSVVVGRLSGKTTVITGAASGIGRATALLFAKEGAKVVAVDIANAELTSGEIERSGGQSFSARADVTKASEVRDVMESAVQRYGKLDVLFCCAGRVSFGNVVDLTEEEWDSVLDTNLKSMFLCAKYAVPHMIKQGGGSIINMSSVSGLVAGVDEAAYDASKAGIILLTKATALDFGPKGVRVNCICPSSTDTPFLRKYADLTPDPKKFLDETAKMNAALRRLIQPEEVAHLALYLASDESGAVTGTAMVIDAGYTAI